jgi:glycosyltransferase involved in cell wall biosynthesis
MRPVNDPPAVSAVLLSYDCEAHIGAALDSVMAQDYDGPLEIVVSDDQSRDTSYVRSSKAIADPAASS